MLAWRLALRELRGGLRGLRLLALCLFLGAMALAAVGSLTSAFQMALAARGQDILGGDIEWQMTQRTATPEERAAFAAAGVVSESYRLRAMLTRADSAQSTLVELKSTDAAYPLYGRLLLVRGAQITRPQGMTIAIASPLADRLGLSVGDAVRIGSANFRVGGLIADEPDRLGAGFSLGPSVLISPAGLAATGLVQPGSLYHAHYRVRLAPDADPETVQAAIDRQFPSAGWEVRDRSNGAPGARRFIERLGQFLTLVSLSALIVAGVGVGNGVSAYLDQRRKHIAIMKALGASSGLIFRTTLWQILLVALPAIGFGLAAGAMAPWFAARIGDDALPILPVIAVYPAPLWQGAGYAGLVLVISALPPLARARAIPAAALFRGAIDDRNRLGWQIWSLVALAVLGLAVLAVATASQPRLAAIFMLAVAVFMAMLAAMGWLMRRLAAVLPHPRQPFLRLALANVHRPGAQTGRLVVALGLGLTLFSALTFIETNLSGQLQKSAPKRAPSFFVLDVPGDSLDRFRAQVTGIAPDAKLVTVPSLRGPVVAVNGVRVTDMASIPQNAWILRGDRGLTYARDLPEGSMIVAGQWWPRDYAGPPLISLDAEAARALGIGVGDTLTISVLGVDVTATIASLRRINWETLGFNFAILFAPGTLEAAPHAYMATVAVSAAQENEVQKAIVRDFASASVVRVKDVLTQLNSLLSQLSAAVGAASAVGIAAGMVVLVGTVAAARARRSYDAVLLKMLGATRGQVLLVHCLELMLVAFVVMLLALGLGALGGWYVIVQLFELAWTPDWLRACLTVLLGGGVMLLVGLAGSLSVLAVRPAQALRAL